MTSLRCKREVDTNGNNNIGEPRRMICGSIEKVMEFENTFGYRPTAWFFVLLQSFCEKSHLF